MENLPFLLPLVFGLTTLLTVFLFYRAAHYHTATIILLVIWMVFQTGVGLSGFYTVTDTFPPRFLLLALPAFLVILFLFVSPRGRQYLAGLDPKILTLLHIVRIPVELVQYGLFLNKAVPELMTFEGRNFDIVAGITAPFVYYYGYIKIRLSKKFILFWNFICLVLLINIVVHAVLSAPFPMQQLAFDQPNRAVLYFPFNLLPACVVPLVFLSHLTAIRQLLKARNQ